MSEEAILLAKLGTTLQGVSKSVIEHGQCTIMGRPGSGKTTLLLLIIKQFLEALARARQEGRRGAPVFVFDPKKERAIINTMIVLCSLYGIPLQIWFLQANAPGAYYSPFRFLIHRSVIEAAEVFASAGGLSSGDATTYAIAFFAAMGIVGANVVMEQLEKIGRRPLIPRDMLEVLKKRKTEFQKVEAYQQLIGLTSILAAYPKLNPTPDMPQLDIRGAFERNEAVLVITDKSVAPFSAMLGPRFMLAEIESVAKDLMDEGTPQKCLVAIDEIQELAKGDLIPRLSNLGRHKGIGFVASTQHGETMLEEVNDLFIHNSGVVAYTSLDAKEADTIVKVHGEHWVPVRSYGLSTRRTWGGHTENISSGEDEKITFQRLPLIDAQYLLSVNTPRGGKVLLHRVGSLPLVADLIRLTNTVQEYEYLLSLDLFPYGASPPPTAPEVEEEEVEEEEEPAAAAPAAHAPDSDVQERLRALRLSHL